MLNVVLFWTLSTTAIVAALAMVTRVNPLSSAVALSIVMIALAGLYALLAAPILAILQILVYAGAILALIVFIIMLLNVRTQDLLYEQDAPGRVGIALAVAAIPLVAIAAAVIRLPASEFDIAGQGFGGLAALGMQLFRAYALPFELVSVLLTVAMAGVVVLAKRSL